VADEGSPRGAASEWGRGGSGVAAGPPAPVPAPPGREQHSPLGRPALRDGGVPAAPRRMSLVLAEQSLLDRARALDSPSALEDESSYLEPDVHYDAKYNDRDDVLEKAHRLHATLEEVVRRGASDEERAALAQELEGLEMRMAALLRRPNVRPSDFGLDAGGSSASVMGTMRRHHSDPFKLVKR
jgi:hypothetical protein